MVLTNDEDLKKKLADEILSTDFPLFCSVMNARIEKNGNKHFLVGDNVTIADV